LFEKDQPGLRIHFCASADLRLDKVCGPLSDGWKQDSGAVLLFEACTLSQMHNRAISAAPRELQQSERRRRKIINQVEAGSTGAFEPSGDVPPTVLIVAENRLDPGQADQREGRQSGLAGLGSKLY